jgi:hypothetical protein
VYLSIEVESVQLELRKVQGDKGVLVEERKARTSRVLNASATISFKMMIMIG